MFDEEGGLLNVEIVTGLQALSRDSDLQKLMQMGEMVRNLPEPAVAMFKWDQYGKALITSLGFNADLWVKSEDQVKQEQLELSKARAEIEGAHQRDMMTNQAITSGVAEAAKQDIMENSGQGLQQALQQIQGA